MWGNISTKSVDICVPLFWGPEILVFPKSSTPWYICGKLDPLQPLAGTSVAAIVVVSADWFQSISSTFRDHQPFRRNSTKSHWDLRLRPGYSPKWSGPRTQLPNPRWPRAAHCIHLAHFTHSVRPFTQHETQLGPYCRCFKYIYIFLYYIILY